MAWQVKCSGRTVWVLFHGGVASSQEAYLGVRSGDAGRTWKLLLSEPFEGNPLRKDFALMTREAKPWPGAVEGEEEEEE